MSVSHTEEPTTGQSTPNASFSIYLKTVELLGEKNLIIQVREEAKESPIENFPQKNKKVRN